MSRKRVLCVVGTRPEAIKMAPVILALRQADWADCRVVATAQHREMLDQVFEVFQIAADDDLDAMHPGQALSDLTARLLIGLDGSLKRHRPDVVLAQGDTTTVLAAGLASFYRRVCFGHVEAGLRTGQKFQPFPEEVNRALVGRLADVHFAPTVGARDNLLNEGIAPAHIHVTGNTGIDALHLAVSNNASVGVPVSAGRRLLLLTAHRRENVGQPLREICRAVRRLADAHRDVEVLCPVHPNPNVRSVVECHLAGHERIRLCEALDYGPFVAAMKAAFLILTDSGGVQEEAPALGKPVLVLRDHTERPEAVEAGVVKVVGPHEETIWQEANKLLTDSAAYAAMARGVSPYGDGHAAERILDILHRDLCE